MARWPARIIQVSNISVAATQRQVETMFSFIGPIVECVIYKFVSADFDPSNPFSGPPQLGFIIFQNDEDAVASLNLHQTVFIDKPLVVCSSGLVRIPTQVEAYRMEKSLENLNSATTVGLGGLSISQDPTETKRIVYVESISANAPALSLLELFSSIGDVKYIKISGDDRRQTRSALVEFSTISAAQNAISKSGTQYYDKSITIATTNLPILKPDGIISATIESEVLEVVKACEGTPYIFTKELANEEPESVSGDSNKRKNDRSRSRSRHRSSSVKRSSRDYSRRSRSRDRVREKRRSKHRSRSRDHSRSRRHRTRSPTRHRTRRSRDRRSRDRRVRRDRSYSSSDDDRYYRSKRSRRIRSRSRERDTSEDRRRERRYREKDRRRSRSRDHRRRKSRSRHTSVERHRSSKRRHRERSEVKSNRVSVDVKRSKSRDDSVKLDKVREKHKLEDDGTILEEAEMDVSD